MLRVKLPIVWGRLRIRELTASDLDFVAEMLGNKDIIAYWPRPLDRAEASAWIDEHRERYASDGCAYWLLEDTELSADWWPGWSARTDPPGRTEISLGYMLHRPFWHRRYASRGRTVRSMSSARTISLRRSARKTRRHDEWPIA
jgi:RimJ/RimL family protein N-acetyltransferase